MRVIIAGGRDFVPKYQDWAFLYKIHKIISITVVLSGCSKGADKFGQKWAFGNLIKIERFPPNWDKYGKAAGPMRNEEMASKADAVILFPGGKGTENMRSHAIRRRLRIFEKN